MQFNSYYQGLHLNKKGIFVLRTLYFQRFTRFSTEVGYSVSPEMKHLISSAFVQITFGIGQDDLEYFNKIHITPKAYSYRNSTQLFHGDVNPMTKTVNLTWPVVKKGFEINDDGMNLAIHEFAHCIILENARRNYLVRNLNEEELKGWKSYSLKLLEKIRKGDNGLYRDYAGSNLMELFATSLEYFFEKPSELFSYDPEHYKRLCRLLKQDPRNSKDPTNLTIRE
ncbi:hypothetical protein SAMN06265375_101656 [Muriicola jejuensis]|nr:hypothetical protein SAMN06265375_101656 [Muriicola jejuensis]